MCNEYTIDLTRTLSKSTPSKNLVISFCNSLGTTIALCDLTIHSSLNSIRPHKRSILVALEFLIVQRSEVWHQIQQIRYSVRDVLTQVLNKIYENIPAGSNLLICIQKSPTFHIKILCNLLNVLYNGNEKETFIDFRQHTEECFQSQNAIKY